MSFSCKKGEFDRCFNQLDWPVEESRPDRPVEPTGAGRPDRFPSLNRKQPINKKHKKCSTTGLFLRVNVDSYETDDADETSEVFND